MTIFDHYNKEKERFLENCIQCGLCAEGCPILPYTDISKISSPDIQEGVFEFMESGSPNQMAYTKAFACMECFKCTADMCPEELNPMLVNLVAEAMGIRREDKFKKYTRWGNLERILKDADDHMAESPFEKERITEVLQAVFVNS